MGPNLFGVGGRKAGSAPDFDYSDAMKNSTIVWSAETLSAFVLDPAKTIPGNKMDYGGAPDANAAKAIADYLMSLNLDTLWIADEVASTPIVVARDPADPDSLDAAIAGQGGQSFACARASSIDCRLQPLCGLVIKDIRKRVVGHLARERICRRLTSLATPSGREGRGSSSIVTHRWREPDSKFQFREGTE